MVTEEAFPELDSNWLGSSFPSYVIITISSTFIIQQQGFKSSITKGAIRLIVFVLKRDVTLGQLERMHESQQCATHTFIMTSHTANYIRWSLSKGLIIIVC
jgi:hypothetical protein